jgi:hypothetical protein
MSTPANQLNLPPIDPSQTGPWLDMQRKQYLAQMLMGSLQQSLNSPNPTTGIAGAAGAVTPRRGVLQSVAPLVNALMAGKAQNSALKAEGDYYNPPPPDPGQTFPGGATGPISVPGQPSGLVAGTGSAPGVSQNPLIPPGMTMQQAQWLGMQPGGREELVKAAIARAAPLEIQRQLRAAGIDPNSPQGLAAQQAVISKAGTNVQDVRPGSTLFDVNARNPLFTGPDNGVSTTWQNGQPTAAPVPGAAAATETMQKAKTVGTQTATPIKLGTDENGKDIYGYPAPPGAGAPNATAPGTTASPAAVQSQKSGAEAGQSYAAELAKNATGATEVRRSISELKNLSQQAAPGAANEAKAKLGAFMIAAGADPANVAQWTGVDTGALQAAQKQTATLAVNSIHSMTSRGTNFDLDTFMRNNPNMNMADPAAFARVADYMNNKASQDIAKQKDFAQWKKTSGVSPDDWETQHTAHWLDQQNQAIDKGQSNSPRPTPPGTPHTLAELQAEAARRGLKVPTP